METDWQDIVRRLDVVPATPSDTCCPKERGRGRGIRKVPTQLVIPSVTFNAVTDFGIPAGPGKAGILLAQFNYTLGSNFRLLMPIVWPTPGLGTILLAYIRYREGTNITRYALRPYADSAATDLVLSARTLATPIYNGQLIKSNFTVEYYSYSAISNANFTTAEITLNTNILSIPTSPDNQFNTVNCIESVLRSSIDVDFPEPLPTTYNASSYWLTN